jgi:RNA ligase (TIGR02306 family)
MTEVTITNMPANELVNDAGQTIAQAVQFRKMAVVKRIDAIDPIPDADAIEVATVGGWKVVIKKGDFQAGQLAVYCEIDSWIPTEIAPYLSKGPVPREYEGIKGERLRTVKLRGQVSQGLLLPVSVAVEKFEDSKYDEGQELSEFFLPGTDVSEMLGIVKYDPPMPASMAGDAKGYFPPFLPKTDQERIQNLTDELAFWQERDFTWEVTEKLDGSSMTVYLNEDLFGVCSRNLELKMNPDNTLWKVAIREKLEEKLRTAGGNYALQGELIGEGIQGNKYKAKGQQFYIFDIYWIDKRRYLTPFERKAFITARGMAHVPVFQSNFKLTGLTIADLLKKAEAKSVMGVMPSPEQEGLVFKCNECEASFKAISNKFLLKNGD